jgi:hypothetical protein
MSERVANVAENEPCFTGVGFVSWFAEIGMERFEYRGIAGFDGGLEAAELCLSECQRAGCAGIKKPALPQDKGLEVHGNLPCELSAALCMLVKL